jgi:hypothetical protein
MRLYIGAVALLLLVFGYLTLLAGRPIPALVEFVFALPAWLYLYRTQSPRS